MGCVGCRSRGGVGQVGVAVISGLGCVHIKSRAVTLWCTLIVSALRHKDTAWMSCVSVFILGSGNSFSLEFL